MSYTPPLEGFKPSLFRKIAEVQGHIGGIEPDQSMEVQGRASYKYVSESKLLSSIRPLLAAAKVAAFVSVDEQSGEFIAVTKSNGKPGTITLAKVTMSITFADGESGETFTVRGQGQGTDYGDKAIYKAITSANRYMWWKAMLVGTDGDDAATTPTDYQVSAKDSGGADGAAGAGSTADGTSPPPNDSSPFVPPAAKKPTPAKLKAFVEVVDGLIAGGSITAEQVGRAAVGKIAAGRPLREEEGWPVLADALNSEQVESLMTRMTTYMANLEKEKIPVPDDSDVPFS